MNTQTVAQPIIAKELFGNYPGWVLVRDTGSGLRRVDSDKDGTFNESDAKLLASAPVLVEALQSAIESLEQLVRIDRIPANNKGLRDARAALRSAGVEQD